MKKYNAMQVLGKNVCIHNFMGEYGDPNKITVCGINDIILLVEQEIENLNQLKELTLKLKDKGIKIPAHYILATFNDIRVNNIKLLKRQVKAWDEYCYQAIKAGYTLKEGHILHKALNNRKKHYLITEEEVKSIEEIQCCSDGV
jgi:hypothetical protein